MQISSLPFQQRQLTSGNILGTRADVLKIVALLAKMFKQQNNVFGNLFFTPPVMVAKLGNALARTDTSTLQPHMGAELDTE